MMQESWKEKQLKSNEPNDGCETASVLGLGRQVSLGPGFQRLASNEPEGFRAVRTHHRRRGAGEGPGRTGAGKSGMLKKKGFTHITLCLQT